MQTSDQKTLFVAEQRMPTHLLRVQLMEELHKIHRWNKIRGANGCSLNRKVGDSHGTVFEGAGAAGVFCGTVPDVHLVLCPVKV